MKQIAVLGLSRFGASVARSLAAMDVEVLGVDLNEEKVNDFSRELTHTVQADILDDNALDMLGLPEFDVVVLCIKDIEISCLATIALKDHGARYVVAQASGDAHAQILNRIGADKIIMPERDMGIRVAKSLAGNNIMDYMELSSTHSLLEMEVPEEWVDRSLIDCKIRNKYGLNVVAIRSGANLLVSPTGDDVFRRGDIIVVVGENGVLDKFSSRPHRK